MIQPSDPAPVGLTTVPRTERDGYVLVIPPWQAIKLAAFLVYATIRILGGRPIYAVVTGFGLGISVTTRESLRRFANLPGFEHAADGWYRPARGPVDSTDVLPGTPEASP